jgi:hypothetical protein
MINLNKKPIITIFFGLTVAALAWTAYSLLLWPKDTAATAIQTSPLDDYFYQKEADDYLTYTHDYGLSFAVPADFLVSSFEEDQVEIITADHPLLRAGFQIVISPTDETAASVTEAKLRQDNPSLIISDATEFVLPEEIPAIRFSSNDPSLGETRELWFIREARFYQIRMYAEDVTWLDPWIRQLASRFYFTGTALDSASDL